MIQKGTSHGAGIEFGGREVTLLARFYRVEFPAIRGGFIWGKPHGVLIKTPEGSYDALKISDRTREFQIGFVVISLVAAAMVRLVMRRHRATPKMER